MVARIAIELSPAACRIVELDGGWDRERSATRIVSFVGLPLDDPELKKRLVALRGRHVTAVVWTPGDSHRQVLVRHGGYDRMRAEARAAVGGAAADPRLLCDIAPAAPHLPGTERRAVMIETAARIDIIDALRPLDTAGITIDAVMTPASALASMARLRRDPADPPVLEAYIALEDVATAVTLVSGGLLLAARTAAWGYFGEPAGRRVLRDREEIAARLASDLAVCLTSARFGAMPLSQVYICGGLPELRSMTASLVERLDVEVEPLDALFGIDPTRLPEPAHDFRERAAEFRLAWAAAADPRPLLDLLRLQKRQATRVKFSRAAVAAGLVAGLGGAWVLERRWNTQSPVASDRAATSPLEAQASLPDILPASLVAPSAPLPITQGGDSPALPNGRAAESSAVGLARLPTPAGQVALPAPRPAPAPPERRSVEPTVANAPIVANPAPKAASPPPAVVAAQPVIATPQPPRPDLPSAAGSGPASLPPLNALAPRPIPEPPARRSSEPLPVPPGRVPPVSTQATGRASESQGARRQSVPSVETAERSLAAVEPPPLPFEAVLGTILYGPDRKLAIVDGRIVQAGDDVRGARIIEITPTAVFLRDAQGRLRRLAAGASGQ